MSDFNTSDYKLSYPLASKGYVCSTIYVLIVIRVIKSHINLLKILNRGLITISIMMFTAVNTNMQLKQNVWMSISIYATSIFPCSKRV